MLRLPLRTPWVTTHGRISEREVILVRAVVDGADGWGECVAQPEPTYSPEYTAGALDVLRRHLIPRLLGARATPGTRASRSEAAGATSEAAGAAAAGVAPALAPVKGHLMAKAALETAVLDAELRAAGVPLAAWLAARCARPALPAARVVAGVAVGLAGADQGALVEEVAGWVDAGYRRVKLKVTPQDHAGAAAVRAAWPDLALQVDGNGSFAGAGGADVALGALDQLDRLGLLMIEQPLADDDLVGHAALGRRLSTPICLDESVTGTGTLATALALGACRVVNLKAGRVGGLLEAVRIHDRCREAGVGLWCGGMLETGVGRAANLALASLPGFDLPGDLSAADRFWAEDVVTEPARLEPGGTVAVPTGAGLGVEVRDDLGALVVSREWHPA